MAERFAVARENLADTMLVDDLRPEDAALIEPLACVVKSLRLASRGVHSAPLDTGRLYDGRNAVVIGLGVMGLLHLLLLKADGVPAVGYDLNPKRVEWARSLGLNADLAPTRPGRSVELAVVCPGDQRAADLAFALVEPQGTVAMFAPLAPGERLSVPNEAYFLDLRIVHAYSCGPYDCVEAARRLWLGQVKAEQVVETFTDLTGIPEAYKRMRDGEILKAMVKF